jgi:murein L,D-transpeptidase YcbB/YkuD
MRAICARLVACGLLALIPAGLTPARADDMPRNIRAALAPIAPVRAGAASPQNADLWRFYDLRGFRAAWTPQTGPVAIQALEQAVADGLRATDYRVEKTPRRLAGVDAAAWDIELSRAFLRYAKDLRSGRLAPGDVYEDVDLPAQPFDVPADLNAALKSGALAAFIAGLPPQRAEYAFLREALAHYRALAARGEWRVPLRAGAALAGLPKDMRDKLRQRLADEDAAMPAPDAALSDADLRDAVSRFQVRLGLTQSGQLNAQTVAALNRPVIERVMQLEADMERWRWMPHVPEKRYVEVNTPDASVKLVENGKTILTSPAVLGRQDWATPILATTVKAVVVNPPWNVPPDLAAEEILPKLRRNASYLAEHNMVLLDGPPADPHGLKINWRAVPAEAFAYRIRQLPGAGSGLGALLLDMPNSSDVYLHDTPAKDVFGRADRFLSHGCVRVRDIAAVASWALYGDVHQAERMPHPPRSETVRLPLEQPLRVYMMYWTAFRAADGTVAFRPDVYGWDARLAAALRGYHAAPATRPLPRAMAAADTSAPAP